MSSLYKPEEKDQKELFVVSLSVFSSNKYTVYYIAFMLSSFDYFCIINPSIIQFNENQISIVSTTSIYLEMDR